MVSVHMSDSGAEQNESKFEPPCDVCGFDEENTDDWTECPACASRGMEHDRI